MLLAGDVAVFDAKTLQPVKRVKQGHMVFCTAVAFSSAGTGLLSVSGDASMRVLASIRSEKGPNYLIVLSILILILAVLLGSFQALSR